ncbi:MAG: hypothetical protein QW035_02410 [Candidatus Anstonellales archaeon]
MEILERKQNKLLEREEIVLLHEFKGATPDRKQLRADVKAVLAVPDSRYIISKTESLAGTHKMKIFVHVYKSEQQLRKVENKHLLIRDGFIEKEKKEGA